LLGQLTRGAPHINHPTLGTNEVIGYGQHQLMPMRIQRDRPLNVRIKLPHYVAIKRPGGVIVHGVSLHPPFEFEWS